MESLLLCDIEHEFSETLGLDHLETKLEEAARIRINTMTRDDGCTQRLTLKRERGVVTVYPKITFRKDHPPVLTFTRQEVVPENNLSR